MNLKLRFSLFFSLLFSLLLGIVLLIVFYLFSNFRKEEFKARLAEKAETTVKLLLEVKEVDKDLLRIIDQNTINRLYNEKTLIFNDSMQLIYSSVDDLTINWSIAELNSIKEKKEVFKTGKEYDVLGIYYEYQKRDYYALIAANDKYGIRNLNYLKVLLLGAFICGTAIVWFLSFYLSKKTLRPLDKVTRQIQEINTKNLTVRLDEPKRKDEIKALSQSFNQMMDRIDKAYKTQKEFASNASHELRTPVSRIVMQLENLLNTKQVGTAIKEPLQSILEDADQLSDIIASLLVLSKVEETEARTPFQIVRLDEIIFATAAKIGKDYPDFKLQFEIENQTAEEINMEVKGNETLLKIVILNLFKNAYSYSDNQTVKSFLVQREDLLQLFIVNNGEVPYTSDTATLFNTFKRGSNIKNKPGSGLGLSIVQKILDYHHAKIAYHIPDANTNKVVISFPKSI